MNHTPPRYEAKIEATLEELEQIKQMLGADRVAQMSVSDNGIAAFWAEGPDILAQCREALDLPQGDPDADWEAMDPETRDWLVSIAAGSISWADNNRLDYEYILDWFRQETGAVRRITPPNGANQ